MCLTFTIPCVGLDFDSLLSKTSVSEYNVSPTKESLVIELNENSKLQLSVDNLTDERTEAYVYAVNDTSWRPRNWMQWIPPRTVSLKYSFSF